MKVLKARKMILKTAASRMIMTGCSAVDCSNRSEQHYILKAFPRDSQLRAIWAAKVKRAGWEHTDCSFLCEVHFDEEQWEVRKEGCKRKLKKNAIFSYAPAPNKRKAPEERVPIPKKVKKDFPQMIDARDALINQLKEALEKTHKKLESQEKTLKLLIEKISKLSSENSKLKKLNEKLTNRTEISLFNDDQILSLN